jgi:RNA polymerase sigma-70 factor (ECF subfamily)
MKSLSLKNLQHKIAHHRDQQAYKDLFFLFYQPLFRFALGFVKEKFAAEEVVSDVMTKIWTLENRLGQIDNLTVYLYRATRNQSLNYIRNNRKHAAQSLDLLDEVYAIPQDSPEAVYLTGEWAREVKKAVAGLPPRCQMVYKLVREDGFTYKEVAAVLEISENTVDRHLNNALHKMLKTVNAYVA